MEYHLFQLDELVLFQLDEVVLLQFDEVAFTVIYRFRQILVRRVTSENLERTQDVEFAF